MEPPSPVMLVWRDERPAQRRAPRHALPGRLAPCCGRRARCRGLHSRRRGAAGARRRRPPPRGLPLRPRRAAGEAWRTHRDTLEAEQPAVGSSRSPSPDGSPQGSYRPTPSRTSAPAAPQPSTSRRSLPAPVPLDDQPTAPSTLVPTSPPSKPSPATCPPPQQRAMTAAMPPNCCTSPTTDRFA